MKIAVGKTIAGYELRELIGQGGFGEIYRANQVSINRDVAIKLITSEFADQPEFIRRFEFEAHLIANLEHPFIVPLYDYWRQPGGAFLVMRWMSGSLDRVMARELLPLRTVVRYLEQIAEALAVAHRRGVIHRDIKPANILLDNENNAYLADFGIAKAIYTPENDQVDSSKIIGSPGYMAPEQILNLQLTTQADIYSLGVVLYEMLSGTRLFPTRDSVIETLQKQLNDPIPPLLEVRPDLPKQFETIIERVLCQNRYGRYHDVLELAHDLRVAFMAVEGDHYSAVLPTVTDAVATLRLDTDSAFNAARFIENPYKGLQAFQEADALDFFGRETVVEAILNRLRSRGDNAICLTITGPSGSGKSSLVRAGLIPMIRTGALVGSDQWFITDMLPGSHPFTALEAALARIAVALPPERIARLRANPDDFPALLDEIMPEGGNGKLLLLIDQFEELFTQVEDEAERVSFIRCLIAALNVSNKRLRVILTLRADFYDRPLMYPELAALVRQYTEVIVPMTEQELEEAITAPAVRAGLQFEPGLVPLILKEVERQPNALPQLQFMLSELFKLRSAMLLTLAAYDSLGGVLGSLTQRAEDVYAALSEPRKQTARNLFLRLVSFGEDGTFTRRRVLRDELTSIDTGTDDGESVIELFVQQRLLTLDRDRQTRQITVEVAHEALLRGWQRLHDWLEAGIDDLRLHRQLTAAAYDWSAAARDESFLAAGARLAQYEDAQQRKAFVLNAVERDFLKASIGRRERLQAEKEQQRQRELQLQRRARRVLLALVGVFLLAAAISSGLGIIAANNADAADRARDQAEASALASRSAELAVQSLLSVNEGRIDQALLLSLEALQVADTVDARSSLQTALTIQPHLRRYWHTGSPVRTLTFSPDGSLVASGMSSGEIALFDLNTDLALEPLVSGDTLINQVAFSPNGRWLASGGADNLIRLWDVQTRAFVGEPLTGHTGEIWGLTFSPDGRLLASAGEDSTIRLWDIETGQTADVSFEGHDNIIFSVAFSSDGTMLASGGADNTIRLWDVETGEQIGAPLTGHENWVLSVAFSPDGSVLASGGADNTIRLWDAESGEQIGSSLVGHEDWVRSVTFSPNGEQLVSGGADGLVMLWDVVSGRRITALRLHQNAVWSAAFHPTGDRIISGGLDARLIEWSPEARAVFAQPFPTTAPDVLQAVAVVDEQVIAVSAVGAQVWGSETRTQSASFAFDRPTATTAAVSANGRTLVVGDAEGAIQRWDVQAQEPLEMPQVVHDEFVLSVAISAHGNSVASGNSSGGLTLVDFGEVVTTQTLNGHETAIYASVFNPAGTRLASGDEAGVIRLWDVQSGEAFGAALTGHTDRIISLAFAPDGRLLASGSRDGTIRLWDANAGRLIRVIQPQVGEITSLAFHPNGTQIAAGGTDDTLALIDVASGQVIGQPMLAHEGWVTALEFSPDGKTLISGDRTGRLITWSISETSQQAWACVIANRNFAQSEWERFFDGEPYRVTCPYEGNNP